MQLGRMFFSTLTRGADSRFGGCFAGALGARWTRDLLGGQPPKVYPSHCAIAEAVEMMFDHIWLGILISYKDAMVHEAIEATALYCQRKPSQTSKHSMIEYIAMIIIQLKLQLRVH
jgi:hypothetical protein